MADIADDIIDGAFCAICGEYFEKDYGYPVACAGCWSEECGYQLAEEDDDDDEPMDYPIFSGACPID